MAHRRLHSHKRDFWDDIADKFGFGANGNDNDSDNENDDDNDVVTVVETTYTTVEPPFEGEVGGYTTMKAGADSTVSSTAKATENSDDLPDEIEDPGLESVGADTFAFATDADVAATLSSSSDDALAAETSTAETSESSSGGGSSTAAKAGIAIGVLAGILVVFGLVYFAIAARKKKKSRERQSLDDEKLHGPFGQDDSTSSNTPPPPPVKAPRISLRPVTQFLPNLGADKGMSKGDAQGGAPMAAGGVARDRSGSAWERPLTSQSQNPANPFGNQAERVHTPIPEETGAARPVSPLDEEDVARSQPASPVEDQSPTLTDNAPPGGAPPESNAAGVAAGVAAGAAAGAAGGLTRQTSRNYGPKPLDLTVQPPAASLAIAPPSPAGTEYSMSSVAPGQQVPPSAGAAAIAAAGGPPSSTVHRVQLDFKPTLEDEMELRAGDLVRLLHEYDDGWALVIRMDRSRQGVVPRTCLSTRPVKPRQGPGPRGPPVNPNGRPMTPQGYPRPQTPAARPGTSHTQRPLSPAGAGRSSPGPSQQPRPQSPGPRYQAMPPSQRPQSPSTMGQKPSPPGPSPMGPGPQQSSQGSAQDPAQGLTQGPPPQGPRGPQGPPNESPPQPRPSPPAGPVSRKPVPGQAY